MGKRVKRRVMREAMAVLLTFFLTSAFLWGDRMTAAAEEETVIEFNASTLPDGEVTAEKTIEGITLKATRTRNFTVDANKKVSKDGTLSFTKRLKSNGSMDGTGRTVTFYAPGPGTVTVYMLSANSKESQRTLSLYNAVTGDMVKNQTHFAPPTAGANGDLEPFEYTVAEAGTYEFHASNAINIYYIKGVFSGKGEPPKPRPSWDDVPDPVIKSVVINDEGKIDVDVSVLLGEEGADSARLFLFQDNFEVTSVDVQEPGVFTLAPLTEGDFIVKVVACRQYCADKESIVEKITDYKLPLASPEITWVNNLGDGSVYVDWSNIDAEKFEITGFGEYMVVAADLKDGNYTLEGLEEGKAYDIKVTAFKGDKTSEAVASVTVGEPVQQWYAAAIGSATAGAVTVNGKEYEAKTSAGLIAVEDVTNGGGKVEIASATNGKIADSEDGFFYYFTKINPNKENFKLTATFTVTDVKDGPDNQTGYGIYATDIAGVGSKDAKYFNSVSVGQFKMSGNGYHAHGARLITGYTAHDAFNTVGATRNFDNKNCFSVKNEGDAINLGDTFTYTLEKTDSGYVASMNGAPEKITFDGAGSIMAQEDGSVCVGVVCARKVGVEITDILFEKSEGTAEGDAVIMTEPLLRVYSGATTGTTDYEWIASANVPGTLEVTGAVEKSVSLEADKVLKLPVTLNAGDNEFRYTFTPDKKTENLSSYDAQGGELKVKVKQLGNPGETIYVSPEGKENGLGTKEAPLDLQTVLNYAQPGQVIVMMDGIYTPASDYVIGRSVNGTEDAPIVLMAENTGKAIIDGGKLQKSNSLLSIVGSYWHVYGLELLNGPAKGVGLSGNYNTVEMCVIHNVGNSGLQISRYAGEPNDSGMWPTGNLVKNCEAYDCCDAGRNDADGFAAKLTCGEGNRFYGCISHNNIDDGWDLYAKSTTGPIGAVIIENCVAYSNGFLSTEDPNSPDTAFGEGNGFKLGGENMFGAHQLINCVSFNNYAKGITSNSGPDCQIVKCTAYNNSLNGKAYNVSLYTRNSNPKAWVLKGMLSVVDNATTVPELGSSNGVIYSLRSANNYLYDGVASCNTKGKTAKTDWFVSTDISQLPTREKNGTINMNGLLVLNEDAPTGTGARIVTTGKDAESVQPEITTVVTITAQEPEQPAESAQAGGGEKGGSPAGPIGVAIAVVAAGAAAVVWKKKKK